MELDLTTFILEIINFLVLVWLLTRFFYRPVMAVIARRREDIRKKLDAAETVRAGAETLKSDYENRLARWEEEKNAARQELNREIAEERRRRREELDRLLDQEREKEHVLSRQRIVQEMYENERRAAEQAVVFLARLLRRLACPELETRLVRMAIEDLADLDAPLRETLQQAWAAGNGNADVATVWPLAEADRQALEAALAQITGSAPRCEYRSDPELIAGLSVGIGAWRLQACLQQELRFFAEAGHEQR